MFTPITPANMLGLPATQVPVGCNDDGVLGRAGAENLPLPVTGGDLDGDGLVDCADSECFSDTACTTEVCDNGTDDDGDNLVDCNDPSCFGDIACALGGTENCTDGVDDDVVFIHTGGTPALFAYRASPHRLR